MAQARTSTSPVLTRRERFCRLYDFEPVDRSIHWEAVGFWGQTIDAWKAAGGMPADADAMAYYDQEPRLGVSGGLGFTSMALGGPPVQQRVIEDDGRTRLVEDDLGKVWRDRIDGEVSMPTWLRFPVECHADWLNKIKPRLDPAAHAYPGLDRELAAAKAQPDDPLGLYLVGLYAFWRNLWGEEQLAYAFYDSPATLHDMAATWLAMHCRCTPRILGAAAIDYVFFHEDMAYKNGPLIGPKLFDEFMAPYYQQVFAELRVAGLHRFFLDSDGNNGAVLERFVDLGMNGLYPFEAAAGCDPVGFRREHPHFFIWGAIDKRALMRGRDEVQREVMAKVPALWDGGGFAPSIDHSLPPCPQENFEYFLELVRDLCR